MITVLLASLALRAPGLGGTGFIRTIDRTDGVSVCQTETMKLTAPGKPDVWLIGAAHIGSKDYYGQLQNLLDAQSVVLYEGVRSKGKPLGVGKPDPKGPKPLYQILSDAIGLDFQLVDIDYAHPNWINSDLSMEDLVHLNKQGAHGKSTQFDMIEQMLKPDSQQAKMIGSFFQTASPSIKEAFKIFLVDNIGRADMFTAMSLDKTTLNVVLTARNQSVEVAFAKTIAGPNPPKSIGIFYGAAHMPELKRSLEARYGYKAAEQQWFTFAKADHRRLDASGRQFLDVLKNSVAGFQANP